MEVLPIKTRLIQPPKDDLYGALSEAIADLQEEDVVVITSKVVAIHQGRSIKNDGTIDKKELAKKEADAYLMAKPPGKWSFFVKDNAIVANAGIDESNSNGYITLLPEKPIEAAREIWEFLTEKFGISKLGVVISDSHSIPFHCGTMGVALGLWGFNPVKYFVGKKDLFGRPFEFTRIDVADSLAVAGVFAMGETSEQTPVCVIRNAPHMEFTNEDMSHELFIEPEEDIYYELLKPLYKKKKKD